MSSHLRKAVRQLRRNPGFSLTAILTLAVGIGATTAIFSIFYAVLLQPLPYFQPDRLVDLVSLGFTASTATNTDEISYPNFRDWRDQAHTFESMASYHPDTFILNAAGSNAARSLQAGVVSSDFFHLLGITPALGRSFLRKEEKAGSRVVILGNDLWVSAFHSSPSVIGSSVKLSDQLYTVVGVLPARASFPFFPSATPPDVWTTPAVDANGENPSTEQRGWTQLSVTARLRDGVTLAQASAEMNTIAKHLAVEYPHDNASNTAVQIHPALEDMTGDVRGPLRILLGAVSALLLIACANVAGLLLARGSSRRTELALRSALGASRSEITLQLLSESLVLSLLGGAAGIVIAMGALKGILYFVPKNLPRLDSIAIHGPILAFAIGVSLLTGIIFGLLPARRLSRLNPALALQDGSRTASAGRRQNRLHAALVIGETAIGLVLLVGAGLLIHSFLRMLSTDPGFNPQHTLTFRIGTTETAYPPELRTQFYGQVIDRLKQLPGAQSATAAYPLPFSGGNMGVSFTIEGHPTAPKDQPTGRDSLVYPGYFETLQIPLHRGRVINELDNREKALPVAVVNEAMVKKYFAGQDPIGKRIATGFDEDDAGKIVQWREIVGVVGNVKRFNITEEDHPEYYVPFAQAPVTMPFLAVRVAGDPAAYAQSVARAVAELDKQAPVYRVRTVEEGVSTASAQPRFQTLLLTAFAAVALLLAAIGLYAVLSYMVAQRTHELGLRMALGAQREHVLGLVMRRGVSLTLVGLGIGCVASLLLSRFIAALLFGVQAFDLVTYVTAAVVLLLVSSLASLIPAARAASLEPMETLRNQ